MINLYLSDVSDIDCENEKLLKKISVERRQRIASVLSPIKKKQLLGAGLLLRHALISHGISPDVEVQKKENGKPFLNGFNFSLSHSGTYVLLASADSAVGVDIEKITEIENSLVAERIFAHEDMKDMDNQKFFSLFTRLESYGKMTGEGLFKCLKTPMSHIRNVNTTEYFGYMISVCTEKEEKIILPPTVLKF